MEWWNGECERAKGRKHERSKKLKAHYSTTPLLHYSNTPILHNRRQETVEKRGMVEWWNGGMRKGENTKKKKVKATPLLHCSTIGGRRKKRNVGMVE